MFKLSEELADSLLAGGACNEILTRMPAEHIRAMAKLPYTYCILDGGKAVAMGGGMEYWPGRAEIWTVFSSKAFNGAEFMTLHRFTKKLLEILPHRRIEATVNCNFKAGHRWLRLLGLKQEIDLMPFYGPRGEDMALYSIIREGKA